MSAGDRIDMTPMFDCCEHCEDNCHGHTNACVDCYSDLHAIERLRLRKLAEIWEDTVTRNGPDSPHSTGYKAGLEICAKQLRDIVGQMKADAENGYYK